MKRLYKSLLELLFPQRGCPLCGAKGPVGPCQRCGLFIYRSSAEPFCRICGRFFSEPAAGLCLECSSREWPFVFSRAALPYEGSLRSAVHRLKFGKRQAAVDFLGGLMADVFNRESAYRKAGMVVPVPLSPARLEERGFNQAELLAGVVAENCGVELVTALQKKADTPAQAQLDRDARRRNIKKSFRLIDNPVVRGKTVVVVDDVFTTGSTLSSAAETLLEGGVKQVFGLVLGSGRTFPK
ncbi:MAG: phosphoribosyltransferase family protein [Bacillota bacterium]